MLCMSTPIHVVGGGLAGSECAFQLARRGLPVVLHEMRPVHTTPAHKTADFAELVCSNSLRSDDPLHAAGLLKREMEAFGSLIIGAARQAAVPAGSALAVDRERFAAEIAAALAELPNLTVVREEVTTIPADGDVVLATGPLTSPTMAAQIQALLGSEYLYFYDAIAPVIEAESLDLSRLFWASRYGKGGGEDYLNAGMTREQYDAFYDALTAADVVAPHDFEQAAFFEGCLPIEEMARRGRDTLRYGPMKPVGLRGPQGERYWAVAQLRQENLAKSQFNLVGFQSRMTWGAQREVLRLIPGLENAEFVRLGQIHRNTFVNAPLALDEQYRVKSAPRVRLAGQITGVEGYLESAATGLAIALYLALERQVASGELEIPVATLPATTALGALARHLTASDPAHFQPANINYGLFTELPDPPRTGRRGRGDRREAMAARAHRQLVSWADRHGLALDRTPLAITDPRQKPPLAQASSTAGDAADPAPAAEAAPCTP
jgi:methylenetetrahydrofolate--tRNA-(uracil-5-)-methyltransferase